VPVDSKTQKVPLQAPVNILLLTFAYACVVDLMTRK